MCIVYTWERMSESVRLNWIRSWFGFHIQWLLFMLIVFKNTHLENHKNKYVFFHFGSTKEENTSTLQYILCTKISKQRGGGCITIHANKIFRIFFLSLISKCEKHENYSIQNPLLNGFGSLYSSQDIGVYMQYYIIIIYWIYFRNFVSHLSIFRLWRLSHTLLYMIHFACRKLLQFRLWVSMWIYR